MNEYQQVTNLFASIALTLPRIVAAFLVLPVLTEDDIPATARNSFFVSLAVITLPYSLQGAPLAVPTLHWAVIIVKEVFLGLALGFSFSLVFWAVGCVGALIDTKSGATMASLLDPMSGNQTSLNGALLGRFAAWLFMAGGGFAVFLEALFGSYSVWPPLSPLPELHAAGAVYFSGLLDELMVMTLLLAAPAMIVLFLIELGLGLLNRYAQQINLLPIASSVKSVVAVWIVLLSVGVTVQFVSRKIGLQHALLQVLKHVL